MTLKLDENQKKALQHTGSPLLIKGCAGTGKTAIMAHKISYLIEKKKVPDKNILVLSFNKKNLKELKTKSQINTGKHVKSVFTTILSFCTSIIRENTSILNIPDNFVIFDINDQLMIISIILNMPEFKKCKKKPDEILSIIQEYTRNKLSREKIKYSKIMLKLFTCYEHHLKKFNVLDQDDILLLAIELFQNNSDILEKYQKKHRYILIDNFPIYTAVYQELFLLLSRDGHDLYISCDSSQEIQKSFSVDIEKKLSPDTKIIELTSNYRLNKGTLNIIQEITGTECRPESHQNKYKNVNEAPVYYIAADEKDEANFIIEEIEMLRREEMVSLNEIAVLLRTSEQKQVIIQHLKQRNIKYRNFLLSELYSRPEISFIINFLKLVFNEKNDLALLNILHQHDFDISGCSIKKLYKLINHEKKSILNIPDLDVQKNCRAKLTYLLQIIGELKIFNKKHESPAELIKQIIIKTGYKQLLENQNTLGSLEQLANIDDFIYQIKEDKLSLSCFLDELAIDSLQGIDISDNAVNIMPITNSKGSEFSVVFMPGVEEGILPHYNSLFEENDIIGESSLFYIGLTRAKKHLYLSCAYKRFMFDNTWYNDISRFITNLSKSKVAYFVSERIADPDTDFIKGLNEKSITYQIRYPKKTDETSSKHHKFKAGDIVHHAEWGRGIVQSIEGKEDKIVLEILFKDKVRKIMAKYAAVKKL
ncbi:MAG: UvrD-helicase domain-containing protein [bacterium]|nr:UvrD-helicase domain-containing protein [bacterium]